MTITREIPAETAATGDRDLWLSMKRGWRQTCPACGQGALYRAYLKVNDHCPHCHEALYHQRADDAPPYFTMIVTGHVVVGGILLLEQTVAPPTWVQFAIWMPVLVLLSLWLLPRIKGTLIGYQWANRMHGFGVLQVEGADLPPAEPQP